MAIATTSLLLFGLLFQTGGKVRWDAARPDQDLGQMAKEAGKPAIAYFRADWSSACRTLDAGALSDDRVVKLALSHLCLLVDVSDARAYQTARNRFSIAGLPTIRFYDRNGDRVDEIAAAADAEVLLRKMRGDGRNWKFHPMDVDPSRWYDTHRVFLRNGNAIDGRLLELSDEAAVLQWDSNTKTIFKCMDIDRIEIITIRRVDDAPPKIELPTRRDDTPPPAVDQPPAGDPEPVVASADAKAVVTKLLKQLKTAANKNEVIDQLAGSGTECLSYACSLLDQSDVNTGMAILAAVTRARNNQVAPVLRDRLQTLKDSEIVVATVNALTSLQDAKSLPAIRRLSVHEDVAVRAAVVAALGQIGDKTDLKTVCKSAIDPVKTVRSQAALSVVRLVKRLKLETQALAAIRTVATAAQEAQRDQIPMICTQLDLKESVPLLIPWMKSRDLDLRISTIIAIGDLNPTEASSALLDVVDGNDEAPRAKQMAASALAKGKDKKPVAKLIEVLGREGDKETRNAITRALQTLTKQRFTADEADQWKKWWDASRGAEEEPSK